MTAAKPPPFKRLDAATTKDFPSLLARLNPVLTALWDRLSSEPVIRVVEFVAPALYTAPALTNSWVDYDLTAYQPTGWWKMPNGTVRLRGVVKSGNLNSSIFTLPAQCRPAKTLRFPVLQGNLPGNLAIGADGLVFPTTMNVLVPDTGAAPSFSDAETPTGTVNGTTGTDGNAVFTFAHAPSGASLVMTVESAAMIAGVHYNLAGAVATFVSGFIPTAGQHIRGWYRY